MGVLRIERARRREGNRDNLRNPMFEYAVVMCLVVIVAGTDMDGTDGVSTRLSGNEGEIQRKGLRTRA